MGTKWDIAGARTNEDMHGTFTSDGAHVHYAHNNQHYGLHYTTPPSSTHQNHQHLGIGHQPLVRPHVAVKRHELDESHVDGEILGEGDKGRDLIVVESTHHHTVHLQSVSGGRGRERG